jgi:hypothetical protein
MMLDRLGSISDRTAYVAAAAGLVLSLAAAALVPQDAQLGAWVRLVIWHGMLMTASIAAIMVMGVLAVVFLASGSKRVGEWARALQFELLPVWVVATGIGALSARLVWNSWNLTERRMEVSIAFVAVAAVALIVALSVDSRRVAAGGQVLSAVVMVAGLAWIGMIPASQDIHPGSAILSSPDVAFKVFAAVMFVGVLVTVFALVVPVRHWLQRSEASEGALEGGDGEQQA